MKEIKLRAWDKVTKIMAEVTGLRTCSTDGSIEIWYKNRDGEEMFCNPQKADIELMQYTGLKDKNGNEIYEGDIVRFGKEIGFIGELQHGSYTFNRKETYWKCDPIPFCSMSFKYVEVIGNVYENSELLEGRE